MNQSRPTVREVREHVQPEADARSTGLGLLAISSATLCYVVALYGVFTIPFWPLQIISGILAGFFIGTMFITGHDACHGSLTSSRTLNQIVGRFAFLPSLTPFTSWDYAHNRIHHSYTNLRGRDYVWAPYSKAEFDGLSPFRRGLEHFYRTMFGFSFHYMIEYWWTHLIVLPRSELKEMRKLGRFALDLALVGLFFAAQVTLAVLISPHLVPATGFWGPFTSPLALVVLSVAVPFYNWCWGMSFCIFQHHNHPRTAWFQDRTEWDFFASQVEGTVHMQYPPVLEWLTANIMQHTAHHVNPKVPLYRIPASQERLEAAYEEHIVVEQWSLGVLLRNLRTCKLYDYDNHRWLDFAGQPTTEPNPHIKHLREQNLKTLPKPNPSRAVA